MLTHTPEQVAPQLPPQPIFARAPAAKASVAGGSKKAIEAHLDVLCTQPDTGVIVRSLLETMKRRRVEAPAQFKKTPWVMSVDDKTPGMTDTELEEFIQTKVRQIDSKTADKAIERLNAIHGFFGLLYGDVDQNYAPPQIPKKAADPPPPPANVFDM